MKSFEHFLYYGYVINRDLLAFVLNTANVSKYLYSLLLYNEHSFDMVLHI